MGNIFAVDLVPSVKSNLTNKMNLTDTEQKLFDRLPHPPQDGSTKKPTIIWLVEWLSPEDQHTGGQLHQWMHEYCAIKSEYFVCSCKKELITTIEQATFLACNNTIPLLHIEAHGDENGLEGPNGVGYLETLTWDELTVPLQQLNLHTRCNLVVFIAACTGFAGINVFFKGSLAPAVALVGPVAPISPSDLLQGAKEFYRRLRDIRPKLDTMVDSASKEVGTIVFELEPFVVLAFEAFAERLIVSKRPSQQWLQLGRIRKLLIADNQDSAAEIEDRLLNCFSLPLEITKKHQQSLWDKMFMIDLFPNNQKRFGIDWYAVIDMVEKGV